MRSVYRPLRGLNSLMTLNLGLTPQALRFSPALAGCILFGCGLSRAMESA
jgi:hypothetical protein